MHEQKYYIDKLAQRKMYLLKLLLSYSYDKVNKLDIKQLSSRVLLFDIPALWRHNAYLVDDSARHAYNHKIV